MLRGSNLGAVSQQPWLLFNYLVAIKLSMESNFEVILNLTIAVACH